MKASQPLQLIKSAALALVLLVITGVNLAQAQTIFVDNQIGSDANPGTSAAAPKLTVFGANGAQAAAVATTGIISINSTGVAYPTGTFTKVLTITSTAGTPLITGGPLVFTVNATLTGPLSATGLTFTSGTVTGANNLTTTGPVILTAGVVTGDVVYAGTQSLQYNGGANLTGGGEWSAAASIGALDVGVGANTITMPGARAINGILTVDGTSTLAVGANTFTLNAGALGTTAVLHVVQGTVSTTAAGLISLSAGTTGRHVFDAGADTGVLGNLSIAAGNFVGVGIDGDDIAQIAGTLTIVSGSTNILFDNMDQVSPLAEVTGNVNFAGTGQLVFDSNAANPVVFGGSLTNASTGIITFGSALNTADMDQALTINGSVTNSGNTTVATTGLINFGSAGNKTITGSVTNSGNNTTAGPAGIIDFGAAGDKSITGAVLNSGTTSISGSGIIVFGATGAAIIAASITNSRTISNTVALVVSNAGNIVLGDGLHVVSGTTTNSATLAGSDFTAGAGSGITGSGNITVGSIANNAGFTGLVMNAATATFAQVGPNVAVGDFSGNGRVLFSATSGDVTLAGGMTNAATGFTDLGATGIIAPTLGNGAIVFTARTTGDVIVTGNLTNSSPSTGAGAAGNGNGDIDLRAAAQGGTGAPEGLRVTGNINLSGTGDGNIITGDEDVVVTGAVSLTNSNPLASVTINTAAAAQGVVTLGSINIGGNNVLNVTAAVNVIVTVGGYTQSAGTLNLNNAARTGTATFSGTVQLTGGTSNIGVAATITTLSFNGPAELSGVTANWLSAATGAVNMATTFTMTSGILNMGATARNLNLTGAANTITGGAFTGTTAAVVMVYNRAISAQTLVSGAGVVWPGTLSLANTFPNGPVWTLSGGNFGVAGPITIGAVTTGVHAQLNDKALVSTGAVLITNTGGYTATAATGKILIQAAGATIGGPGNWFNLEIDPGAASTVATAASTASISNELRLTSGIFSNAGGQITKAGGTVFRAQGIFLAAAIYTGLVDLVYTSTAGTLDVNPAGGNLETVAPLLELAPATGGIDDITLDLSGIATTVRFPAVSMTGVLTIPAGQFVDIGAGLTLTAGTGIVNNGSILNLAGTGIIALTRATGTAITGAGIIEAQFVTVAAGSVGNSITGTTQLQGSLTVAGGATASNITLAFGTAPAGGNITVDLNTGTVGANGTVTLGANTIVGADLHHLNGAIAMGAFNLTVGTIANLPTHTYAAPATMTGTGTLTFDDNGAGGVTTMTGAGTIGVPVNITEFAIGDTFTLVTGPFVFANTTVTNGVLVGAAALTTFNGTAVTLANANLLSAGGGGMLFAPAVGTQTVTGEAYLGGNYSTNGTVTFTPRVPGTPTIAAFPGNLTVFSGTTTIGGPTTIAGNLVQTTGATTFLSTAAVTGTFTLTAGTTTLGGATTVTAGIVHTLGDIALGANTLTSTGNYTRTAGTISGTGTLVFNGATFTAGGSALTVPNLTLSGTAVGAQTFASPQSVIVTGLLTLNNASVAAPDFVTINAATPRLHVAALGNVMYIDGTLDGNVQYDGAVAVLTAAPIANRAIPAQVWPATATVNLFRVTAAGFSVGMPGDRTVQNEVHLNSGLLDLDNDTGGLGGNPNTDLTVANSTLRVTAGTLEGGANGNLNGDLLFTNPPTVIYETNAIYGTGEELDNVATAAALTITRATNGINSATTLNKSMTVTGLLDVRDNFGIAAGVTLTLAGNFTVTNDVANFAAATIPVFTGTGSLAFGGAVPQTFTGAVLPTNVIVNNATTFAAATTVGGALTVNQPLTAAGALTVTGNMINAAATTVAGTLTVGGTLAVTTGTLATTGNVAVTGAMTNASVTTVGGTLAALTINPTAALAVTGGITTGAGTSNLNAAVSAASLTAAVGSITNVNATLTLAGASTNAGTMTINGADVAIGSTLAFSGGANTDLTFAGTGKVTGTGPLVLTHTSTANQGYTRGLASTFLGGCSVVPVRKNVPVGGGGTPVPMRMAYPLCNAAGNYRPNAITFNDTRVLTVGNTLTSQLFDVTAPIPTLPAIVNGIPFSVTTTVPPATFNIARFSPFYWVMTTLFDEVPAVAYDVELRAAGYAAFAGEEIERVRNIRQVQGAPTNFWSTVSQSGTNDNFAVSTTEPVGISRGAVGLLSPQGTVFVMGLESNMTTAAIAAKTLNAGTTDATTNLATVFTGGTAPFTYVVTSSDAAIATGTVGGTTLTVNGLTAGGPATLTVTVTDALRDTRTSSVLVTVNPGFTATAGPAVTLNPGQNSAQALAGLFTGGTTPYTYIVTTSDGAVSTGTEAGGTATLTAVGQGTATISVQGTDALGSVATATFAVTVNAPMAAAAIANVNVTQGATDATTNIAATFTGGQAPYTYVVTPDDATIATASEAGGVVSVVGVSGYVDPTYADRAAAVITVTATDALGSTFPQVFNVDVIPVKGDVIGIPFGTTGVDITDAIFVLDFAVGLQGPPAVGTKRFIAGDWNNSGGPTLQAFDAFQIFFSIPGAAPKTDVVPNVVADLGWGEVSRTGVVAEVPVAVTGDAGNAVSSQMWATIDPASAKVVGVVFHVEDAVASAYNVTEEGELSLAVIGGLVPADGIIATISLELVDSSVEFEIAARGAVNANAAADIDDLQLIELPEAFALLGNYPNPFNPSTTISFDLPATAEVSIEIYDMLGRRVMVMPAQSIQAGAKRSLQVNASALASGSYFYRVIAKAEASTMVDSGRMLLVK